ncbi:MAG: hypothetical protein JWO97_619 [Acidobacteria bacterium]|nr:hypothetical protein [Acidobacteriota bacterium]
MRRHLPRLLCIALMLGAIARPLLAVDSEGGYANRTSVAAGDTIEFRIATAMSPFDVELVNLAHPTDVLTTIDGLTSIARDCTGMWETGCGWPLTTQFTVPSTWPSGYYAARFPTSAGTRNIIFVVRAANPGTTSPIVVISPTNTYTAYNQFSGKSVYDTLSTNNQRAHIVSFNRPYADTAGLGRYPAWEQQFVDWMTSENRPFEVVADDDLEDPSLLGHYKLAVIVGHSEYWTRNARRNLENFSAGGGHIAIFGGNTMWWQARLDLPARQFICYKDASLDPENGVHNNLVTVNWYDSPVFNPENGITGESFRNAGYVNRAANGYDPLPTVQRVPYTVVDPNSWVFAGTGVTKGQQIAQATGGIEVDGVIFNSDGSGNLTPDGSDGTPLNFNILATIPAEGGYGTIGLYTNARGAAVFNAGTRDWSHGLAGDVVVAQMTRNVLDRLATGQALPYQPRNAVNRTSDNFNVASPHAGVLPGWSGDLLEASLTSGCAHEGGFGLRLTGAHWTQLVRNIAPDNSGLAAASVNFYVNVDQLTSTADWPIPLVKLSKRTNGDDVAIVVAELQMRAEGKSLRVSTMDDSGARTASSNWIVLPSGWLPVRMSWRSPGRVELQAGAELVQTTNPQSAQTVNEVFMEFVGSDFEAHGSVCIDELSMRDPTTHTSLISSRNPSTSGGSVTFTATVSPAAATGTITLREGNTTIASGALTNGVAIINVSVLAPGTHPIVAVYSGDALFESSSSSVLVQRVVSSTVRSDLNDDGRSDIVLQNSGSSAVAAWLMTDNTIVEGKIVSTPGADWQIVATGDTDGDGKDDIIVRNRATGAIAVWRMNGTAMIANTTIAVAKTSWRVVGARNFNHDGRDDLVLQDSSTGSVALWQLDGATLIAGSILGNPGIAVRAVGIGNFGGDAIIFRGDSGTISRWIVNGTTVTSNQIISTPASDWNVVAVGDYNGDGNDDLALQNLTSRTVAVWLIAPNGFAITQGVAVSTPVPDWRVVGGGDYDGNGRSDLLLWNSATNAIAQWQMNGTAIAKGWNIATQPGWRPLGN